MNNNNNNNNNKRKRILFSKLFTLSLIIAGVTIALIINTSSNKSNKSPKVTSSVDVDTSAAFASLETNSASAAEKEKEASDLLEYEKNTINVYKKNAAAVVNITNVQLALNRYDLSTVEIPQGAGSGFIWNTDGYIVTNFHVVQGGNHFLISFHQDKKQYKAKVVGYSPRKDIAVLKLDDKPSNLSPITLGISKNLQVGQKVMAIGNPFGLDHTLSTGIVSAIGREIPGFGGVKIEGMIQTDASINPGNSGGPLIDSRGNLIGMNTMIFSKSGTSAGVGFALPVDTINLMVPQLIKHGREIRPGLGISPLEDRIRVSLGIPNGVVIRSVASKKSAAAAAGLKGISRDNFGNYHLGDIILAIDGVNTDTLDDIYSILDNHKVGDVVELTILRGETTKKVKLTLMKLSD
ncbi:MAG: trypsin-like peptidase domain-containing protein [Oligoflexia bacterium]|nr:trypsin-like peptidase domain-containing protein [Oligoflexia bacterium]